MLASLSNEKSGWNDAYLSERYKKHWHYSHPSQELATLLATGIVTKGPAIDLGCGGGIETMFLAENGFRASGIDVSYAAIELAKSSAKKHRLRVDFRTGSVLTLPYPDSRFAFLNDRGCLHNLKLDEWSRYASDVARVAKPGAHFLLRGASDEESPAQFTNLTGSRLEKFFSGRFVIGTPMRYTMVSDAGTLQSLVAVLTRMPH